MTGEEEGDFTGSFVSYPDCVHAHSLARGEHLPETKANRSACRERELVLQREGERESRWGLDKLNFHTDKEEVGGKTFEAR